MKKIYEPLISILVPCYNNQQFIYEMLESVFCQTYHHIEVLIGDDGSPNFDSAQLEDWLNKHQPEWLKRVSVYENRENIGTVANIHHLQQNSLGEYLLNIAADDALYDETVLQSFVERINEIQDSGEQAEIIMAQLEMWDHEFKNKLNDFLRPEIIDLIKNGTSRELFAKDSIDCCLTAQYLYKRCIIEKAGNIPAQYRLIEDWPSMLRLLRQGVKIHYMDNPPVAKHRDGGISHSNVLHSQRVKIRFLNELVDCYYNEIEPYEDLLGEEEKRLTRANIINIVHALSTEHLPVLEDSLKSKNKGKGFSDISFGKELKKLLTKNSQMKYIWQFLFWTVLFILISEHTLNPVISSIMLLASGLSFLLALCGIVVKSWIIARYRLRLF